MPRDTSILCTVADGFAPTEVPNLTLTIGLVVQSNLTMAVQGLQEAVTVTAEAPVVETTSTEVAPVVTQEQIEMLPIANRQAGSLALLLPGTQLPTGTRRARPTVGAGGANANLTTSYVDGGQNQIYNSGQEFLEVPQSGIREFRVNITGASAQYGAIGGVVLTATKSGTNQFHGEAFEFFRDDKLNRMDRFEQESHDTRGTPKPEYRRNQYGGALGGPIVQNRAHFFAAAERTKEPKTVTVRTGQSQFYSAVEGNLPAGYERRQLLLRGDLQINDSHSAFVRYLWDKEYTFCEECGGFMAGNTGNDTDSPRDSLLAAHTWVISSGRSSRRRIWRTCRARPALRAGRRAVAGSSRPSGSSPTRASISSRVSPGARPATATTSPGGGTSRTTSPSTWGSTR